MCKKIISLIMSIIICLSCIIVPCSLAEAATLSSSVISSVRDNMIKRSNSFSVEVKSTDSDYGKIASSIVENAVSDEYATTSDAGDYLSLSYSVYSCSVNISKKDNLYTYKINYNFQYYTSSAEEQKLKKQITSVLSSLNLNKKSDYEKVKAIHDYICKNVKYDNKNLNNSNYTKKFTAYAALINGTSVCQGYATLFYKMCKEAGVDSKIIMQNGVHSWNIVKIGNSYYNIDLTWDDTDNSKTPVRYDFFLKCNTCFTQHDKKDNKYNSDTFKKTYPIAKECYDCKKCKSHKHTTTSKLTKATISKDGKIVKNCSVCKSTISTTTIPKISNIKLSTTAIVYNGKIQTPTVTVKDSKGKVLKKDTDYTIAYASGRKNVGRYSVKVTFKGNYSGTKILYFNIIPKPTTLKSISAQSKGFTVNWNKQTTQTTGYQIQYATKNNFSNAATVLVTGNSKTSKKITGRASKTKYYVRVRTYKTVKFNGKDYNIFSSWSPAKTIITK